MIQHNILEYAELLLFLLAAMTYVNTMQERNVFSALRSVLVSKGYSLNAIFLDYWRARFLYFSYRRQLDDSFGDGCRGYGSWRRQQSFYWDGLY